MRLAAPVALLLVTAACGGSDVTGEYGVFYTTGPDAYDDDKALRDLQPCLEISGTEYTGGADSLPPQRSIDFEGSEKNRLALEECLRGLPDTRIPELTKNGPTPEPSPVALCDVPVQVLPPAQLRHTGCMRSHAPTAVVRQWAREQGIAVGDRGRLSPAVLAAYQSESSANASEREGVELAGARPTTLTTGGYRIAASPVSGATGTGRRVRARVS